MSRQNTDNNANESNNNFSSNQSGGVTPPPDRKPLVFFQEYSLLGMPKRDPKDYIKHEKIYNALGSLINASHITGLQRLHGMWRIYRVNIGDKATLINYSWGQSTG